MAKRSTYELHVYDKNFKIKIRQNIGHLQCFFLNIIGIVKSFFSVTRYLKIAKHPRQKTTVQIDSDPRQGKTRLLVPIIKKIILIFVSPSFFAVYFYVKRFRFIANINFKTVYKSVQ